MATAVRYKSNQEEQMTIVNNAFMKILDNIQKFKVGTSYFSWAKRIVVNTAIDDFRSDKKYKDLFELGFDTTNLDQSSEEVESDIEAEVLRKLINELPPATKVVFNLFAVDGLTNKEISEELDITYETVKWHLKFARKELREKINLLNAKILA